MNILSPTTILSSAGNTRGLYTLVGATLMAASIIPSGIERAAQIPAHKSQLTFGHKKPAFTADTFQLTKVDQGSGNAELIEALYSVYDILAKRQTDLDIETRGILHSRLWDLYE